MLLLFKGANAMNIFGKFFDKPDTASADADLPYPLLLVRSREELAMKTASHNRLFHLSEAAWTADLEAGEIVFTSEEFQARASLQVIGTIYKGDGTWLWAWANDSIPAKLCAHAEAVRAYGEKHGVTQFSARKFQCTEAEGWDFTALACKLGGGQGAYCGPDGDALVFMTFGAPSISNAKT
ncbi:MAG: hypothetical protein LBB65_01635 [Burkholderiales bacterium]|jgi:hypothetical protein|nr:hypothetical protein [Burkholderiales bacterium]